MESEICVGNEGRPLGGGLFEKKYRLYKEWDQMYCISIDKIIKHKHSRICLIIKWFVGV